MGVQGIITTLDLAPHPEGGYYRRTWLDDNSSAIYYLQVDRAWSKWHRVRDRVEIWHFYAGAPLELSMDLTGPGTGGNGSIELGVDLANGQRPQAVVPAGAWQRSRSLGAWTLVGCTVTPPFTFDAFDIAPRG
jgi:predicted cupin superfamily sugar epimerase